MSKCPDLDFNTNFRTTNTVSLFNTGATGSYTNANGTWSLDQVAVIENQFLNNIVTKLDSNELIDAVAEFGDKEFYGSVNNLNNAFSTNINIKESVTNSDGTAREGYEVVFGIIEKGRKITPFEMALFMKDYYYDPTSVNNAINGNNTDSFLSSLNDFYNGSFLNSIMGGFCSALPNIFGVFALFDEIQKVAGKALAILSKIKNFENPLKAFFDALKVEALITKIKDQITKVIDKTINKVKNMVENFSLDKMFKQAEVFINQTIAQNVMKIKEEVMNFFDGDFINNVKEKAKNLIDYACNLLKNPTLEQILFLMARFCGLANNIAQVFEDAKKPLDQFVQKYKRNYGIVKSSSAVNTGAAIENGARRYSDEKRTEEINRMNEDLYKQPITDDTIVPNTDPPVTYGDLKTGRIDPVYLADDAAYGVKKYGERLKLEYPPTPEELAAIPNFDDLIDGKDPRFVLTKGGAYRYYKEKPGGASQMWWKCGQLERVMLMRLQKQFGKRITILSAFRGDGYNEHIRKNGSGAVDKSAHTNGRAFDCTWSGFNATSIKNFKAIAVAVGFNGIGTYIGDGFIHVDTRTKIVNPDGLMFWDG